MPADPSRLELFGPLLLTGILRRHSLRSDDEMLSSAVSLQWRDLLGAVFKVMALLPPLGYGAGLHFKPGADSLEFFCGFVLRAGARMPEGLQTVAIPDCRCAVFPHSGPLCRLPYTLNAIFGTALPLLGLQILDPAGDSPSFVLRARPSFSPSNGFGGVEILVPLTPSTAQGADKP